MKFATGHGEDWELFPRVDSECGRNGVHFDAESEIRCMHATSKTSHSECRSGDVFTGSIKPTECAHFGVRCTPDSPLGAPMVSAEGACAAYYRYSRQLIVASEDFGKASGRNQPCRQHHPRYRCPTCRA